MESDFPSFLKEQGLSMEDIKTIPLPFILSDKINHQNKNNLRIVFNSIKHQTLKYPKSNFYKHISTILDE